MTAPPYPGPTKTLSTNYTVDGTQFAVADEDGDALEPEDIWRMGRAVEEHTHDDERGLPVRRVEVASAPQAPGHVQILDNDLRWWAAVTSDIRTAVSREGDQVLNGTWRFNLPLLMAAQLTTPAAPGANLSFLYAKPDGRLYIRSGAGPETGVGAPPTWNLPAKAWETEQTPGVNPELIRLPLLAPTWALAYDKTATEVASQRLRVPATYVSGLPLVLAVAWTAPSGVAPGQTLTWRMSFARCGRGDPLPTAYAVSVDLADAYQGAESGYYQIVSGGITVPNLAPGDSLYVACARVGGSGDVPGDAFLLDGSVAFS